MALDQKNVNISLDPRQHKCSECRNVYKHFKHLKQHFKVKHSSKVFDIKNPATTSKPYKCDKCDSQFSKIYSLNYHIRKGHDEEQPIRRTFQCSKCPCKYSKDKYLRSHMRKKHAENNQTNQPQISKTGKCPICDCSMLEGVIFHFSSVHQINIDIQSLEFASLEEFTAWKANIEKETIAKFVKKRGSNDMNTYVKHYYICHRTGNYRSQSKGHRMLKRQGSNKIGGICPASMTVNENKITGKCNVNFITNHIGHENTLDHLFLTREEREEYLAKKIASRVPFNTILDDVRDTISDQTSMLDKEKAQLKASIMNLLDLSDSLTTIEEVRILKKIVSSAKPTLMASRSNNLNKPHHTLANSGPSNKNILPQRRLYATKRKKEQLQSNLTNRQLKELQIYLQI